MLGNRQLPIEGVITTGANLSRIPGRPDCRGGTDARLSDLYNDVSTITFAQNLIVLKKRTTLEKDRYFNRKCSARHTRLGPNDSL